MSSPKAGITLRPELARSSWLDAMNGKSLRKIGRDRQGEKRRSLLLASPQQGVSPRGSIKQGARYSTVTT
jgi:hypothetical protein